MRLAGIAAIVALIVSQRFSLLQVMHVYWSILIYQMIGKMLVDTSLEGDIRSDAEYTPLSYEEQTSPSDVDTGLSPQSSQQSLTYSQYSEVQHRKKGY
jgi:hypothetical protein